MKITTFNPSIITKEAEPIIKLFEELGYAQPHKVLAVHFGDSQL